jgi:DNA invertase Pin-like site-specific DNA recombinase
MNGSQKVQPAHLSRQAVIYIRQSDPKQVRQNRESGYNQRALRERVLELGWRKDRIDLVDEDQGRTAKHTAGRDAFQKLAADVGLRKVGIIVGYEVSRLARLCRLVPAAGTLRPLRHLARRRRRRLQPS